MPGSILQASPKNSVTSLLLTLESLVAIGIYFGTKFYDIKQGKDDQERGGNSAASTGRSFNFRSSTTSELCPLCDRPMLEEPQELQRKGSIGAAAEAVTRLTTESEISRRVGFDDRTESEKASASREKNSLSEGRQELKLTAASNDIESAAPAVAEKITGEKPVLSEEEKE